MKIRGNSRKHHSRINFMLLLFAILILFYSVYPSCLNVHAEEIEYAEGLEPAAAADVDDSADVQVVTDLIDDINNETNEPTDISVDIENPVDVQDMTDDQIIAPGSDESGIETEEIAAPVDDELNSDDSNSVPQDADIEEAEQSIDSEVQDNTVIEPAPDGISVTGLSLDYSEISLVVGDSFTLSAAIYPEDASNTNLYWNSMDESVASITDGVVTAIASGETTVIATTEDGRFTAECLVKVSDPELYTVVFDANGGYFEDGSDKKSYEIRANEKITPPEPLSKDGFMFTGWIDSNGNTYKDNTLTVIENISLRAVWEDENQLSLDVAYASGITEDGISWTLDNEGTLTLKGAGTIQWHPWNAADVKRVEIVSGITGISEGVFSRCINLESVTIPDGVTKIGNSAFSHCVQLKNITIPNSTTAIGERAFDGCTNLTQVKLPDKITELKGYVFYGCTKLESITIPDSVTTIRANALNGTGITKLVISQNVKQMQMGAFAHCHNLKEVILGNGLERINDYVFYGCDKLTSITIPKSVKTIGTGAFMYCSNIQVVNYGGTKQEWSRIDIQSDNSLLFRANIYYSYIPPERIIFEKEKIQLGVGEQRTIEYSVLPKNASIQEYAFLCQNDSIATVDNGGIITGKALGTTEAQVIVNGSLSASISIEVIQKISEISIIEPTLSVYRGSTIQVLPVIYPEDATESLVYKSDNEGVAVVDSKGVVSALRAGKATITISAYSDPNKKTICEVSVIQPVTGVVVNRNSITVCKGRSIKLQAILSPTDASDKTVTWESNDDSIATVDNTGFVSAVALGTTMITATAADGSGKSASCEVKVIDKIETNEMYRLYNPKSGEHFYTASINERDTLVRRGPWKYEGVAWNAPVESDYPVYRMYSPKSKAHHYTMDENERDTLCGMGRFEGKGKGWNYEGIGWYSAIDADTYNAISDAEKEYYVPLHRLYNPRYPMVSAHHYTADENEVRVLTTQRGWVYEGIAWYGAK